MTDRSFTHNAMFVGLNGSMGLVHGKTYYVRGYQSGGYLWVEWVVSRNPITGRVRTNQCPYGSIRKVEENWVLSNRAPDTESTFSHIFKNTIDMMLWRRSRCYTCAGYYAPSNHSCDGCVACSAWRQADDTQLNKLS